MASLRGILALAQISGKVEVDSEAVISCDSTDYECRQPPALSHLMYSWSLVWSYLCFGRVADILKYQTFTQFYPNFTVIFYPRTHW